MKPVARVRDFDQAVAFAQTDSARVRNSLSVGLLIM
jgi:hypothetical protein